MAMVTQSTQKRGQFPPGVSLGLPKLLSFSIEETGVVGDQSPGGKLAESFLARGMVPEP